MTPTSHVSTEFLKAFAERRLLPSEAKMLYDILLLKEAVYAEFRELFPELCLHGKLACCCHCYYPVQNDVGCTGCGKPLCSSCATTADGDEFCGGCRRAIRR
jgi:hypothetical protein